MLENNVYGQCYFPPNVFETFYVSNISVNIGYCTFYVSRIMVYSRFCICLMTSLSGLLALDSGSQCEELSYSHVFNAAPYRYTIGNFCHDPLIINIKIDTMEAAQNDMHLLPD